MLNKVFDKVAGYTITMWFLQCMKKKSKESGSDDIFVANCNKKMKKD